MDFNEYSKNNTGAENQTDLFNIISALAKQYDGKGQAELIKAIYKEAEKGKKQGTLTNADIDKFANTISPFLDQKQRAMLSKIVKELKKI